MKKLLITGSSGLIGSEAVAYFDTKGYKVIGIDNNMRMDFFGPKGDTTWNRDRLLEKTKNFESFDIDIRDRKRIFDFFKEHRPDVIIHCAAQPSHDLSKIRPLDDFDVNAVGTINLLESSRHYTTESPFIFMSTNKVYGDAPNELPIREEELRYDYARPEDYEGIDETCRIDRCLHSLFGASKVAGDIVTQEYGRNYDMPTVCFRCGCITGPNQSGVEQHGFLNYLVKNAVEGGIYSIFGYKGKQVRDQMHSIDMVGAFESFIDKPRCGEVYNIGGGRQSNASLLECLRAIESKIGRKPKTEYVEMNRAGDHICYISNTAKFRNHYPEWSLTRSFDDIIDEMLKFESQIIRNV
ncbi:MAG: NAD-dependent epimerase/dehydratase family protein [bacterium]